MNKVGQFTFNRRAFCRWQVQTASLLAALLILWLTSHSSSAFQADIGTSGERRSTVARAKTRITIDGLDEADWLETPSVGEITVDPQEKK